MLSTSSSAIPDISNDKLQSSLPLLRPPDSGAPGGLGSRNGFGEEEELGRGLVSSKSSERSRLRGIFGSSNGFR